ncbi:hypothetical protein BT69DRAFT_1352878 [Atractiella rhizophila]|nr:hypothetical protein BT69DRAFT_1352878 [Atractiella rhizophila]
MNTKQNTRDLETKMGEENGVGQLNAHGRRHVRGGILAAQIAAGASTVARVLWTPVAMRGRTSILGASPLNQHGDNNVPLSASFGSIASVASAGKPVTPQKGVITKASDASIGSFEVSFESSSTDRAVDALSLPPSPKLDGYLVQKGVDDAGLDNLEMLDSSMMKLAEMGARHVLEFDDFVGFSSVAMDQDEGTSSDSLWTMDTVSAEDENMVDETIDEEEE